MKNKVTLLVAILGLLLASCDTSDSISESTHTEKKISILGDSYSAFSGYLTPATNTYWYGTEAAAGNDVTRVEQMWWHLLINQLGDRLECNNSYSGSTICNTGYGAADFTTISFITRMKELRNPDIILILGGTNDSWAGVLMGDYKYQDWDIEDLKNFRPAFCYMLDYLKREHPRAQIYHITNTELSYSITTAIDTICRHYKVGNIELQDIDKISGHPSIKGMQAISAQVLRVLAANR